MRYLFKSDSDRWSVINHLKVAAQRYDEDAKAFQDAPGQEQLVRQFNDQAQQARRIAKEIEELDD